MSQTIEDTASFFGADLIGNTELNQAYVYSHRGRHTDVEHTHADGYPAPLFWIPAGSMRERPTELV